MATTSTTPSKIEVQPIGDHIVKSADTCGGKARIAGTRIRVQDIYVWHELQGRSVDQIVSDFRQLNHAQVHAALSYFFSHMDEIRKQMADDEQWVAEFRRQNGPGPLEKKLAELAANAPDNPIPSR
jgi:uncharacterized protein (DUF433 family)